MAKFEEDCIISAYEIKDDRFVTIRLRSANKWAVVDGQMVLNHNGEMEYEPLPSSRTEDFIRRTRFDSPEEAYEAYKKYKIDRKPYDKTHNP